MKKMITVAALLVMVACNNKSEATGKEASTVTPTAAETIQKDNAISAYLKLKDALVQTDANAAKEAAANLAKYAEQEGLGKSIIKSAQKIAELDDVSLQRVAFEKITDGMIEYVKSNDQDQKLFVQFCPMAFNNAGAHWLSAEKEVMNPYFGDKMLRCGVVKETIQ